MKTGKFPDKNRDDASATSDTVKALGQLISRQTFFKGLKPIHVQSLADLAMEKEFKAGEHIFREGDPANRFYLILEGRVALHYEAGEAATQTLGPGDDLGWSWLFPPYYFLATAQAVDPVKTIFFYGTRLRQRCEEDHDLGYEIMKRIAQVAIQHLNTARRTIESGAAKDRPRNGRK
jgi:CRP-like cAMP-binding protein